MKHTHTVVTAAVFVLGLGLGKPALAEIYYCVPVDSLVLENRAQVLCAEPIRIRCGYPEDPPLSGQEIKFFAVPLSEQEWANRFIQVAKIAQTAGLTIRFSYTSGDTSGTAFDCMAHNCRTPWAFAMVKVAPPWPDRDCAGLGTARAFNLFVFGDLVQSYADTGGRLAAGGDATFTGYSVGSQLSELHGDTLVVGGTLDFTYGSVIGDVAYGESLSLNGVSISNGTDRQDTPVDFDLDADYLRRASSNWGTRSPNGTTSFYWGQLQLDGNESDLNVFEVSGSDLANAWGFNVSAPAGSTVLINVTGTVNRMRYFSIGLSGITRDRVLFNFFETTDLTIEGISIEGSLLAPLADVEFNNAVINGTLVAESLRGNGEPHHHPFIGFIR